MHMPWNKDQSELSMSVDVSQRTKSRDTEKKNLNMKNRKVSDLKDKFTTINEQSMIKRVNRVSVCGCARVCVSRAHVHA